MISTLSALVLLFASRNSSGPCSRSLAAGLSPITLREIATRISSHPLVRRRSE
jgi:hypothetical protein